MDATVGRVMEGPSRAVAESFGLSDLQVRIPFMVAKIGSPIRQMTKISQGKARHPRNRRWITELRFHSLGEWHLMNVTD